MLLLVPGGDAQTGIISLFLPLDVFGVFGPMIMIMITGALLHAMGADQWWARYHFMVALTHPLMCHSDSYAKTLHGSFFCAIHAY